MTNEFKFIQGGREIPLRIAYPKAMESFGDTGGLRSAGAEGVLEGLVEEFMSLYDHKDSDPKHEKALPMGFTPMPEDLGDAKKAREWCAKVGLKHVCDLGPVSDLSDSEVLDIVWAAREAVFRDKMAKNLLSQGWRYGCLYCGFRGKSGAAVTDHHAQTHHHLRPVSKLKGSDYILFPPGE